MCERGGALTHMHFQMVAKGDFNSLPMLNKKIKVALGWDAEPCVGHVVPCKKLRDEGLHIFCGYGRVLWGYCMKTMVNTTLSLCIAMFLPMI